MEKKTQDFSMQEAQRLANTPEGQKLVQLLQERDSAAMQKAMADASAGNYKEAGKALSSLLSSPEVQQLIREMGERHGGF